MESGQAIGIWGLDYNPRARAVQLASVLGFESEDDAEVAQFLQEVDVVQLTSNPDLALTEFERRQLLVLPYIPVIEPPSDSAVITEDPAIILKEGRFDHIPVLTGINSAEGSVVVEDKDFFNNEARIADLNKNFAELVGAQIRLPTEEERLAAAQQLEDSYFGEQGFNVDNPQVVYDFLTDMFMAYPSDATVRTLVNVSSEPVFSYYFDCNGTGYTEYGAPHRGEVKFIFLQDGATDNYPSSPDGQTSEKMITLWTNFAKYGHPAPEGSPVSWNSFSLSETNYLDMKFDFDERQDLLEERMQIWRTVLPF